ncbi:MAG: hypothetical protein WBC18_21845 [Ottowia sp.]
MAGVLRLDAADSIENSSAPALVEARIRDAAAAAPPLPLRE